MLQAILAVRIMKDGFACITPHEAP